MCRATKMAHCSRHSMESANALNLQQQLEKKHSCCYGCFKLDVDHHYQQLQQQQQQQQRHLNLLHHRWKRQTSMHLNDLSVLPCAATPTLHEFSTPTSSAGDAMFNAPSPAVASCDYLPYFSVFYDSPTLKSVLKIPEESRNVEHLHSSWLYGENVDDGTDVSGIPTIPSSAASVPQSYSDTQPYDTHHYPSELTLGLHSNTYDEYTTMAHSAYATALESKLLMTALSATRKTTPLPSPPPPTPLPTTATTPLPTITRRTLLPTPLLTATTTSSSSSTRNLLLLMCMILHVLLLSPPSVRCQTALDPCSNNECQNGGLCVDRGYDYTCNCSTAPDYTGWYCNVSLSQTCDSVSNAPCQNGAVCKNVSSNGTVETSFECDPCPEHFEGPLCEKAKDYCGMNGSLCQNGGDCRLNALSPGGYTCDCDPDGDYVGPNCADKIDDCIDVVCNNGRCQDGIKNHTCVCENGWNGATCNLRIDACQANAPVCQHGQCVDGTCVCEDNWTGDGCDKDKNECELTEPFCLNGANCTNREGGYNCSCTLGYRGDRCDEPFCDGLCEQGSTCRTNATNWWCICPMFVEGQLCDIFGPCFYRPCETQNSISCEQSVENNTYTCYCNTGWQGKNCSEDVNECTDPNLRHQCSVNSECENLDGSYTCNCDPGYTGTFCETDIDECAVQPCAHGGECTDQVNNFTCDCLDTGYKGLTCSTDIDECKETPSLCNKGTCSNRVPKYVCLCGDRWRGDHCERENPCYNISCQHGGTCQENVTLVEDRCACADGYEGVLCEKVSRSSEGDDTDLGVIIGPIVGGVVLIIIIIVVIAFVMTARSKRATRGAYSPSAQENAGSRVELGNVLKKPPEERLI